MTDPLGTVVGLGQLGALVEIARRLGTLRSDYENMKDEQGRLRGLYQKLRERVRELEREVA